MSVNQSPKLKVLVEKVKDVFETKKTELTKTPKLVLKIIKSPIDINLSKKPAVSKFESTPVCKKVVSLTEKFVESSNKVLLPKLEEKIKTEIPVPDLKEFESKGRFSETKENIKVKLSDAIQTKNVICKVIIPAINDTRQKTDSLMTKKSPELSKDYDNTSPIDTDVFYSIVEENQRVPVYSKNLTENNEKNNEKRTENNF